jgi:hypothetical protein
MTLIRTILIAAGAALALSTAPGAADAQTAAILIAGAGGPVPTDFLVRNRARFEAAGIPVEVVASGNEAVAAARRITAQGRKFVLVGMSRGGRGVALALAGGARAAGAVFVSAPLGLAREALGSPSRLPPTLVVHHRRDGCDSTAPGGVGPFVSWSGGRARVAWFDNDGPPAPNPCGPRGAHGYFMNDGPPVSAIISFIRSQ